MVERFWHILTQNSGTKLISVIIAVVLWVVVLGSRNVEVVKEVPLEIITPAELVPANDIPEKIAFRLSGPKAFLRTILDRHDDPIRVNLAGGKPGLVTYRFFSDNIRVPIGVKVLSINPTAILIKLEYVKRRDVPVRAEFRGSMAEGYRLVRAELKPPVVRIKGAESRVDSVTEVQTLPVELGSVRQSMEREVGLDIARQGVQVDGPLPRIALEVEPLSANYRIKNVDIRVLSSYKSRVEEKTVTVLVRANPKDLKNLDKSLVYAVVDLRGKPKGSYLEPVKVTLPDHVSWVKTIPEKVNITLD